MARKIGDQQLSLFETVKSCSGCGLEKPIHEFSVRKDRNALRPRCNACVAAYARTWRKANPEAVVASRRRHYLANQEQIKASQKVNYWTNAEENRRKAREHQRFRKYGLTHAQYQDLLKAQDGKCAICGATESGVAHMLVPLVVDHEHDTRAIRGLLCNNCNTGLGQFADNPDRLVAAATYLIGRHDLIGHMLGGDSWTS